MIIFIIFCYDICMKIALVHDFLVQDGGAERVLKVLKEIYPKAPIFTLLYDEENFGGWFDKRDIRTTFLQKMPLGISNYQMWLSLMPAAVESLNLMDYDLIISNSSSFAKGVITRPGSVHISYCHTPTRFLWNDTHSYLQELKVNPLIKAFLPLTLRHLRNWDRLAADRVDHFFANSENVSRRIRKYYQRDSRVLYPPVQVGDFSISNEKKEYYLAGGRLVPYKRIDLAVRAFSRINVPLKVFGVGPELDRLQSLAKPNVEFLGKVDDGLKQKLFSECIAYINPQEEDFGITAVEAMAAGRPVIAFRAGGTAETVIEGLSGEFFDEQIWEDIADKVIRFKPERYDPEIIRKQAEQFSVERFKEKIKNYINEILDIRY